MTSSETCGHEQPTQIPPTTSIDNAAIASKIKQHWDEVTRALNVHELMPQLSKELLLDFNQTSALLVDSKSTYDKSCYILQCLEAKGPTAYTKFLSCIKAEGNHMGHAYIASLLEGNAFGSQSELEESLKLKEAIQRHYPALMDISPEALAPLMYSKKLLTKEEEEKIGSSTYKTRRERVHLLLHSLDTKGPLAHRLFVKCLKSESSHPIHKELYTVLTSWCHSEWNTDSKKQQKHTMDKCALAVVLPNIKFFRRWGVQGPLKGGKYDEMVRVFHTYHHNGKWKELEIKLTEYEKGSIPEYKAVANLQRATIWILRKEPEKAMQFVAEAKRIIEAEVHGENHSALLGRCECMLSRHFQYLKDYNRAREHVAKAKVFLCGIEASEDSAFIHYCEASLTVECLNELSTKDDIERVEELFARAIIDDQSNKSGLGLFTLHSSLRLAQMYLGSTHYTPGTVKDIKRAQECLRSPVITPDSLPERTKCLYHLIESDLHRNCGRIDRAKESLKIVLAISQDHNFELEISSAQTRMQSLIELDTHPT